LTFDEQMAIARARVAALDKIDGGDRELSTIWSALDCGLRLPETGSQYDALVMLEILTGENPKQN